MFQISLAAAIALSGLLLDCPVATHGATLDNSAKAKRAGSKEHAKNIAQELNLTGEQKQQLKSLYREQGQKLKQLRAQTGLTRQQKRAQLNQLREERLAKLKSILTPEQLEQWQKLRGEIAARHGIKRLRR
jgi:Spy/CpxP family protein refolding chaperone